MKKVAALVAAAVLAIPGLALADNVNQNATQQQDQGKVVAATTVAESALVKAVDVAKRTLTLQLSDGSVQTFIVDPAVRRLGEVHPGDMVNTTYTEALTVQLTKNPVQPGVRVESTVRPDRQSPTPAGAAETRVSTTATITNISGDGRRVTLNFPDNSTAVVQVQDPENLAKIQRGEVKPGDQIIITYIRAVAVAVEKAPKK